uniref:Right handed beta helix domain-containing protein n=1 Tax=Amphimedon queenslandica TaxID=400682 RepID=A0A1X7U8H9_AMPQE
MSLLLVVVLLFFSSSCSVSSGQYYVSDDCSSVTQSPCNPLSVYAGIMSQYNNTIFYFIGTSVINFTVTMDSVQNITLHGLDQSPAINCSSGSMISITSSSHVSFSNMSFNCPIDYRYSSNITIAGSILKNLRHVSLQNVFDGKITSSVFDNVPLNISYHQPPVCYNELHHYSLTLTNVTMTNGYFEFDMKHDTSYNISVILDKVNFISLGGFDCHFSESLFSLYITNSSVSKSGRVYFYYLYTHLHQFKECDIKGVESQSTIVIEDSQFNNNIDGIFVSISRDYFHLSNYHIDIIVKSCSISDTDEYGLFMVGGFSTSAHISVIDTELVGNWRNEIAWCLSINFNNITVTNSLSTGLVIIASLVTAKNRLVFKNNTGVVGGGIAINDSSLVYLSPSANLEFIDNHATYKGGGIYIDERTGYTLENMSLIPLTLKNNTAGVAGNDIYGQLDFDFYKLFNSTNPSTSSDASAFAFCDPDSNETTPIWYDDGQQSVFPGQTLKYNVALFGRTFKTNSYSLTDGRLIVEIIGTMVTDKYINNCSLIEYMPKYINYGRLNITLIVTTDTSFSTELGISFILNECPIGFSVNSSGLCDCSVSRENVTCDINTLDITHNGLLWIGTYHTSTPFNDNETNPNACIINEDCLLYCSPNPVTFQLNHTDTQCVDNRGGRMCGSCTEGYSLLMGSNKCGQCHNNYMMIGWIALFAVMGVLLVALLIALNLTVSVGTLNGLLFYANIVNFILIVVYHLYLQLSHMKCYDALIKKLFKKQDEDNDDQDLTKSHLTVDQQMKEIVPTSTDVRLRNNRESVVDLFQS